MGFYGVVSDIHANLPALEACLHALQDRGAKKYLCAGDIIGYYPHADPVVDRLRGLDILAIAGNHDRAVRNGTRFPNPYAAAGVEYADQALSARNKDWLGSLPTDRVETLDGLKVGIFHGSPWDPDRYVFENEVDERILTGRQLDVAIMGHTHQPYARTFPHGLVLNPGSVGQPRDGDRRASCALMFTDTAKGADAEILRVEYDLEPVVRDTRKAGLPDENARRLYRGF